MYKSETSGNMRTQNVEDYVHCGHGKVNKEKVEKKQNKKSTKTLITNYKNK